MEKDKKEQLLSRLRACREQSKASLKINIQMSASFPQPMGLGTCGPGLGTSLYFKQEEDALQACREAGISEEEIRAV